MATMEDVAKAAKVSRATVSRVLSNYPSIKPETRQQVMYESCIMSQTRWRKTLRDTTPI